MVKHHISLVRRLPFARSHIKVAGCLKACAFYLFVILLLSQSYASDEEGGIVAFPSSERMAELQSIALEIVKYKPTRNHVMSAREYRKLQKLTKDVEESEYELVWALYDHAVSAREKTEPNVDESQRYHLEGDSTSSNESADQIEASDSSSEEMPEVPMEELHVLGTPFSGVPINPEDFSYADIQYMRSIRSKANRYYSAGEYDKAYPLLLELSKRGFKDSQSRLAYILLNGTDNVAKSNYRALGWLGASANGRTEPIFKVLLNKHLRQVPEEQQQAVAEVVAGYQEEFGFPDHVNCSTNHKYYGGFNHSKVKRTYCQFKLEQIAEACGGNCWAHKVNVSEDG